MPESSYNHPLFGVVHFKTAHDYWKYGDDIKFISGFDPADIKPLHVPQLVGVPGVKNGTLAFHRRGHAQLKIAFADLEKLGLLRYVTSCAGSLNFRLRRPISGALSKLPSNHAFGIAIDLNANDGANGKSVTPVAPVFEAHGFRWGIEFNDPMHFEIEEFIADPVSVAHHMAADVKQLA